MCVCVYLVDLVVIVSTGLWCTPSGSADQVADNGCSQLAVGGGPGYEDSYPGWRRCQLLLSSMIQNLLLRRA